MNTRWIYFVICAALLAACAPSANAVNTAIAQTEAANPTATLTSTRTPRPSPTPSKTPTRTPRPSPTPGTEELMTFLNTTLTDIEAPVKILDVRYEDSAKAERSILHIDTQLTGDGEKVAFALVLAVLKLAYLKGYKFEDSLSNVNITEYDDNLKMKNLIIGEWEDFTGFFEERLTVEQFLLRITKIPF